MNIRGLREKIGISQNKLDEELSKQIGGTRSINNIENGRGNKDALVKEIIERGLVLPVDIPNDTILNLFQECFPGVECSNANNAFTALFLLSAYSSNQIAKDLSYPNPDDIEVKNVIYNYLSRIGKAVKVKNALESIEYYHSIALDYIYSYGRLETFNDVVNNKSSEYISLKIICDYNPFNKIDLNDNVFVSGIGGCGKTFFLLHNMKIIIERRIKDTIPFYIPLKELTISKGSNNIIKWLTKSIYHFSGYYITPKEWKELLNKKKVIILADGLNEISNYEERNYIITEISNSLKEFKNLHYIVSSRRDDTLSFECHGCSFIKVQIDDLTDDQIDSFLKSNTSNIRLNKIPAKTRPLLRTAQALAMFVSMINRESNFSFESLATLLLSYCRRMYNDNDTIPIPFEAEIEKIAYKMALKEKFTIDAFSLEKIIDRNHFYDISNIISNNGFGANLNLFIKKKEYSFQHQNIRDMFACRHLADLISTSSDLRKVIVRSYLTENDDLLEMISAFLPPDTLKEKIYNESDPFIINVLIRIYAYANKNNISGLKLKNKNLKDVSLSGYLMNQQLSDKKTDSLSLTQCEVSYDTFLPRGLEASCSESIQFSSKSQDYIAFFSKCNIIVYNINTHVMKSISGIGHYFEKDSYVDYGWIRCLCKTSVNEELCIIFGTRSGHIMQFYPNRVEGIGDNSTTNLPIIEPYIYHKFELTYNGIDALISVVDTNNKEGIMYVIQYTAIKDNDTDKLIGKKQWRVFLDETELFSGDNQINYKRNGLTKGEKGVFLLADNKIWHTYLPINRNNCKFELVYSNEIDGVVVHDILMHNNFLFVNNTKYIVVFSVTYNINGVELTEIARDELESNQNQALQSFLSLTPCSDSTSVIAGVQAINKQYDKIANLYKFNLIGKHGNYSLQHIPIIGEHRVAVHSGIEYQTKQDILHIASVADDRSIQILTPNDTNITPYFFSGHNNGIHFIETKSNNEFITANYDGSVSRWLLSDEKLYCLNTVYIHKNLIWKAIHINNHLIATCSSDGTVSITDLITGETFTGIRSDSPIIDIDYIKERNGYLIMAITKKQIYSMHVLIDSKVSIETNNEPITDYLDGFDHKSIAIIPNKPSILCSNSNDYAIIRQVTASQIQKNNSISLYNRYISSCCLIEIDNKPFLIISGNIKYNKSYNYVVRSKFIDEDHIVTNECCYVGILELSSSKPVLIAEYTEKVPISTEDELNIFGPSISIKAYSINDKCEIVVTCKERIILLDFDGIRLTENNNCKIYFPNKHFLTSSFLSRSEACNGTIILAELDGIITAINISDNTVIAQVQHHANLFANEEVILKQCTLPNDFEKTFSGYFNIQ